MILPSLARPADAVVIGASGGIGGAFVTALASADFATVHALARRLPQARAGVKPGRLDLLEEPSIAAAVAGLAGPVAPRLIVVASGILHDAGVAPEKTMRALDGARLAQVFAINTIGPALVAKHMIPLLPRTGKCVFAVLSARVGSIGDNRLGGWYGYRASKAALNQIVRTLAIEARRTRPEAIIVALHPGTVATPLSAPFGGTVSAEKRFTPEQATAYLLDVIEGLTPQDSGGFFAWDGQAIAF